MLKRSSLRFSFLMLFVLFLVTFSNCSGTRKQADVPIEEMLGIELVDPYTIQLEDENARLDSLKKANDRKAEQALAEKDAEIERLREQEPNITEEDVYKEYVDASYVNYWMDGEPVVHYIWITDAQASKLFKKSYLPYYNSLRAQGNKIKTVLEIILKMQKQGSLNSKTGNSE